MESVSSDATTLGFSGHPRMGQMPYTRQQKWPRRGPSTPDCLRTASRGVRLGGPTPAIPFMPLTLSAEDVTRLQSALTTLLSPLGSAALDGWGVAAMSAARSLLGADRAVIGIPDGTDIWSAASDTAGATALQTYLAYYNEVDVVLRHRRRELGLEVYHRDMLYQPRASRPEFGERGAELLQLLLPAFKAGVNAQRRLAQHRAGLLRLLDSLDRGLEIFDEQGRPLHQNPALGSLLEGEPQAQRIRDRVQQIALAVSGLLRRRTGACLKPSGPLCCEVRTGTAIYRLTGAVLGQALLGPDLTIGVGIERVTPEPISDPALKERYRLTPREVQVARLLGQGDSSAEIARSLGISRYTARHHTENVMRKLDVRSRGAVAALLMSA